MTEVDWICTIDMTAGSAVRGRMTHAQRDAHARLGAVLPRVRYERRGRDQLPQPVDLRAERSHAEWDRR